LLGYINQSSNASIYLVRTDSKGNALWTKTYGEGDNSAGVGLEQTNDGGFALAGNRTDKYGGHYRGLLIRTNSSGDSLWTKVFDDTSSPFGTMVSCILDAKDGGFLLSGSKSVDATHQNAVLIKTNPAGEIEWQKTYFPKGTSFGTKVIPSSDGGYLAVGQKSPEGIDSPTGFVLKTNAVGDSISMEDLGKSGATTIADIRPTSDGGYCLIGSTSSQGAGGLDFMLMKMNASLGLSWAKAFGGSGNDTPIAGFQTKDAGYFMVGSTVSFGTGQSDWLMVKTDTQGNAK
jgi:hypothetical protein